MTDRSESSLSWVLVDGTACHVSRFATLPARQRPIATCPECGRRVTLKLGEVRRHHASHPPNAVCAATNPETALHLDCKLALAAALRDAIGPTATLTVVQRCAERSCDESTRGEWIRGWTAVGVEHTVGDLRRPDIVVYHDERPSAAIEIVASNAVSREKAQALRDINVPWIEIRAEQRLTIPGAWSAADPLIALRTSEDGRWRCQKHAAQYDAEREARRRARAIRAARVVDIYHPDGVRERFIYRLVELLHDGAPVALQLLRWRTDVCTIPFEPSRNDRQIIWTRIREAYDRDVEHFLRTSESFADSPMRWARGGAAEDIIDGALTDRVGQDPTPLATRYPRRWFFAKDTRRWFQPADMRDVSWNRPDVDAFAPHPAWSRAHLAIRERPAPEGSWQTPIFASRPTAAMFEGSPGLSIRSLNDDIGIVELASADRRRGIVVIERTPQTGAIAQLASLLAAESIDALWISHPLDWSNELAELAWAPAGRDWRRRGAVVIDGRGVYRPEQLVRAIGRNDRRLTSAAIKEAMHDRVQRLNQREVKSSDPPATHATRAPNSPAPRKPA